MKRITKASKLHLSKDTVRALSGLELAGAVGALIPRSLTGTCYASCGENKCTR